MENILFKVVPKSGVVTLVEQIFKQRYHLNSNLLLQNLQTLTAYLQHLDNNLTVVVEHPYVDKVYRNIYYHYYSSKLEQYHRQCIKLSFFKDTVTDADFRNPDQLNYLQQNFGGFLILRPTFPSIIGRSVLSPAIIHSAGIEACSVAVDTTVSGVKLKAIGFPHSSQDGEMLTCAETTIWSLMEYFGNRYAEYQPVLPDKISKVLNSISYERLIPSKGLTGSQISFAIKEFGFGVRGYSRSEYGAEFEPLLKTYVESGIPVVAMIENNNGIGHALNVIGRESYTTADLSNMAEIATLNSGNKPVLDFTSMPMKYVFIDDNYPPYQLAYVGTPATYYTNPKWAGCSITSFVVPLYPKIYLEADEARKMSLLMLENVHFQNNDPIVLRTFLASSRTFKHSIAINSQLNPVAKELILGTSMPKFIWVSEISDTNLLETQLCSGLIVLDATEPMNLEVLACMVENSYITLNQSDIKQASVSLQPFSMFNTNLKYH